MAEIEDPLLGYRFKLDVQGKVTGFFTEISGVGSETETIEHKVVDPNTHQDIIQKVPGRLKWGDITLKRGITKDMDIWDWRGEVEEGDMNAARKNGSITMYNLKGAEAARWNFVNGWPQKVTGPNLKADSNEYGVEELVIVHEGIKREKV